MAAKTQTVRGFDVVILGPAMILGATQIENPALKLIVGVSGVTTILYNLANYASVRRRKQRGY
jgi:hypothetical protein